MENEKKNKDSFNATYQLIALLLIEQIYLTQNDELPADVKS